MKKKWTVVDALRHSRHDWLNRLQLIKAHLSLGNTSRVEELINEFVGEAQQESRLMNLKMPLFTELLLTYSWESPPCCLEYEVLGEVHTLTHWDAKVATWTKQLFCLLHEAVDGHAVNYLCITIEQKEQDIRFFFDFRGRLENTDKIQKWLAAYNKNDISVFYAVSHEELSIEMQLKEK
jgi:stage 0 sporulation protein B (sporulation initiation phosphotransferase)